MYREQGIGSAAIAAGAPGAGLSGAVDMRSFTGGILKNDGTDINACDIVFKVCQTVDGTFTLLYDENNALVRVATVAANTAFARTLPGALFGAFWVKLQMVTQNTATPVNATNAQTFALMLKT